MGDITNIRINKKNTRGYRLVVKNVQIKSFYSKGTRRAWVELYNPSRHKIVSNPLQTYFSYKKVNGKYMFVREHYEDLWKDKLTPITSKDIFNIFRNYGF